MTTTAIIQITIEGTAALICILIFGLLMVGRKTMNEASIQMTGLLVIAAFLLITDSLAYAYRGNVTPLGIVMTRSTNFLVYAFQFVLLYATSIYLISIIKEYGSEVSPIFERLEFLVASAAIIILISSQATGFLYTFDETNHYQRGPGFATTFALGVVCFLVHAAMVLLYRDSLPKQVLINQIFYIAIPFISVILQFLFYGFSFMNVSIAIILIAMFGIHEIERIKKFEEQTIMLAKQQEMLTEQRIQMVTSQIQPHFLFNALSTISSLCSIDAKLAETAIDNFADYLRINLDTIGEQKLIPFTTELKHTQTYLWLEQLRFGEDLNIEYNIECDNFMIPPLVLQPVAENAVKHGICKKEDGGTVKISTHMENDTIYIIVEDDGAGFDSSKPLSKEKTHVGINNVKHRLNALCNGTLEIESIPGLGTKSTITIKENKANESTLS